MGEVDLGKKSTGGVLELASLSSRELCLVYLSWTYLILKPTKALTKAHPTKHGVLN